MLGSSAPASHAPTYATSGTASAHQRDYCATHPDVKTWVHAGQGVAPHFGDYEAQRHWMELTLHMPPAEWYVETLGNNLSHWGIDYPPLSAYQSYASGLIVHAIEPEAVRLVASKGYESARSKRAMRLTVILSDLCGVSCCQAHNRQACHSCHAAQACSA